MLREYYKDSRYYIKSEEKKLRRFDYNNLLKPQQMLRIPEKDSNNMMIARRVRKTCCNILP